MLRFLKYIGLGILALMANDCIPYKKPGEDLTASCTAAVTGKTFVKISGNRTSGPLLSATSEGSTYQVAPCTNGVKPLGVSMYDAPINGFVGVIVGGVVPVTAGAAIAAGQEVQSNATGQAIPWDATLASRPAGICLNGAALAADAEVLLYD